MGHTITVPDELYEQVAALAERRGQPVEVVVAQVLAEMVRRAPDVQQAEAGGLDWTTASAEEIIADLRANRVERERDVEL